ncbi:hypothetical protein NKH77_34350 [Streptomyces sp. M19]
MTSVRMLGSDADAANLFQWLDSERYITSIEDRVLAGVRTALKEAGLSTAAFDRTSQEVNNQYVTISGGSFNGPMAWGKNAEASQKTTGDKKKGTEMSGTPNQPNVSFSGGTFSGPMAFGTRSKASQTVHQHPGADAARRRTRSSRS